MMHRIAAGLAIGALFAADIAFAQAQMGSAQFAPDSGKSSATGIPAGPMTVYPGIDLAQGYTDNLLYTDRGTKSSMFTIASPYLRAETQSGPHRFKAELRMTHGHYWDSSNDNFTNYRVSGDGDLVFDGRTGLRVHTEFHHSVAPRGTNDLADTKKPDEYNRFGADGVFRYGAPGAQGRIEIDGGMYALRYTNNRSSTEGYDYNTWQAGGTFFWRVMPRTEVLLQAQHRNYHYVDSVPLNIFGVGTPSQDSSENRVYAGLKWEATAKTTGTLRLGKLYKNFDSSAREDYSSFSWDAGVRWSPLTYSTFDLTTSKQSQEATGVGDAIIRKNYALDWTHGWNSRLSTSVIAGYSKDDFIDSAPHRRDNVSTFGARVRYDFRRWLNLGAEYTYTNRDSNIGDFDFQRNLFMLTVRATM